MLQKYFKTQVALKKYGCGTFSTYLKRFIMWLEKQGYSRNSVRCHIYGAFNFITWAKTTNLKINHLDRFILAKFSSHLAEHGSLYLQNGAYNHVYESAKIFVRFLEAIGAVEIHDPCAPPQDHILFLEFREWMRTQRGTMDSTLGSYRQPIVDLIQSLGDDPSTYTAKNLREFLMQGINCFSEATLKIRSTGIRMFLRFLIARGSCMPGLEYAVPPVVSRRLSSLPKYLPDVDVEKLINSCVQSSQIGSRDRAILLLLSRLGLRAGDVSALKFSDIDWFNGTLLVSGKSRCEARLTLPQDVGDAILHYLEHGRPLVANNFVFITTIAPFKPISRQVVSHLVANAINRTGINASSHGAYILRHSLATRMLREGLSLQSIGIVLRHKSIETTTIYAKVDINLLKEVALPWPED